MSARPKWRPTTVTGGSRSTPSASTSRRTATGGAAAAATSATSERNRGTATEGRAWRPSGRWRMLRRSPGEEEVHGREDAELHAVLPRLEHEVRAVAARHHRAVVAGQRAPRDERVQPEETACRRLGGVAAGRYPIDHLADAVLHQRAVALLAEDADVERRGRAVRRDDAREAGPARAARLHVEHIAGAVLVERVRLDLVAAEVVPEAQLALADAGVAVLDDVDLPEGDARLALDRREVELVHLGVTVGVGRADLEVVLRSRIER